MAGWIQSSRVDADIDVSWNLWSAFLFVLPDEDRWQFRSGNRRQNQFVIHGLQYSGLSEVYFPFFPTAVNFVSEMAFFVARISITQIGVTE